MQVDPVCTGSVNCNGHIFPMGTLIWLILFWQSSKPIDVAPITSALRENRFPAALELTEKLLAQDRQDPRIWTLQGFAYLGLKDQDKALQDFRRAVTISPNYVPALKAEAQIEYGIHDKRCVQTLNRLAALEPSDPVTHAMLGALAYQAHDCRAVVTNYSVSKMLIASQAEALAEYGECLFQIGQTNESIQVLAKVVTLEPASWQPRYNLAVANLLLNRPADSLGVLQPVLDTRQSSVLDVASSAFEQSGDTPRAVKTLREAILTDPSRISLYLHFADLCFAHNSFQVGVDMLSAGLQKAPNSAQLHLARGILFVQLGKYEQAESDFDKAAQLDPSQSFSSVAEGLTQLQRSNLDGALATTRAQLKQTPNNAYLYYVKAETLRQKGVEPGSVEFHEAITAAQSAVRLNPSFPLAQDLLGTFYLRQGKLDLAIQQFDSVLKVEPENEPALYHLITASRRSGNTGAVPDLMKRLARAKALNKEKDERMNRYTFVEPNRPQ